MSGTMLGSHHCHYNKVFVLGPNDQLSSTGYLLLQVQGKAIVAEPILAVLALTSVTELV